MRGILGFSPVLGLVLVGFAPQPAVALPTCEQEVRIRCSGNSVQGRGRLDIYYNSFEECVATEQPLRCGTQPQLSSVSAGHINFVRKTDIVEV
jgi:hypothetical protein